MAAAWVLEFGQLLFHEETTMGLINPKPRFAYDDESDMVYDYVKQRDAELTDRYEAADGLWNLNDVKRLILSGQAVEAARVAGPPERPVAPRQPDPPLQQPGTVDAPSKSAGEEKTVAGAGLSVPQLIALNLSPIQAAALRLTSAQLSATGVTAEQVQAWDMTPERADALKLTPEQRAVLLPGAPA